MAKTKILSAWLSLLFPSQCLVCSLPTKSRLICGPCTPGTAPDRSPRCTICWSHITTDNGIKICPTCQEFPLPYQLRFLWHYEHEVRDLITSMKYRPSLKLAKHLGNTLADYALTLPAHECDLIVPLPSTAQSIRSRGFQPTAIFARAVASSASCLHLPTSLKALRAIKNRPLQASLAHRDRLRNARNNYRANSAIVRERSILLVEDVVTTGATLDACVSELFKSGASRVQVLALARSANFHTFRYALHRANERTSRQHVAKSPDLLEYD